MVEPRPSRQRIDEDDVVTPHPYCHGTGEAEQGSIWPARLDATRVPRGHLLSSESVNPTFGTIAEVAAALGLKVTLTAMTDDGRVRITEPMRACA